MPDTTTRYSLPFPELTDSANVPTWMQGLADAIDDAIGTVEDDLTAAIGAGGTGSIPKTLIDAKGDLIVGTANDTVARLPVGSNGQVLTLDSATTPGIKWATPSGGGTGASLPAGAEIDFAGASIPAGFLSSDGSAVSRTTYSDLFAAVGTTYGAGNGTTTFTLPDRRGRVIVGKGTHTDVDSLGDSDGLAVSSRTPKHNSTTSGMSTDFDGAHSHTVAVTIGTGGPGSSGILAQSGSMSTSTDGSHWHSITGSVGPGGTRPNDMPAYGVANKLIKT